MTAEDRILFACTRQSFLPEHRETVRELVESIEIDWDVILGTAEHHGVAPLVGVNLDHCGDALGLPLRISERFKAARRLSALRKQLAAARVEAVLDWLAGRSIDVMILKGAALDLLVYDHPWLTESSDVDLVLRCRRSTEVFQQIHREVAKLAKQGIEPGPFEHHDVTMNGVLPVDFEQVWRDARPVAFRGRRAFIMGAEDLLLAACINACRKRFFRLKSLLDVAECSRRLRDLDGEAFVRRARAFQCGNIVYAALLATRATLGCEIPPGVLEGLGVSPVRARVLRGLVQRLAQGCQLASLSRASVTSWRGRLGISLLLPYASYTWPQALRSLSRSLTSGAASGARAVLLPDRQQDQAVGDQPDAVEHRVGLAGARPQSQRHAIDRFDPERGGEEEEEPVARVPPETEEEQARDRPAQGDGSHEHLVHG